MHDMLLKCIRNLSMLRKIDELPIYMQDTDSVNFIKEACVYELYNALGEDVNNVHSISQMSVSDIAGMTIKLVKEALFTDSDSKLYDYATELTGDVAWYNRGVILLTQYKEEYLRKVRELNPSQYYMKVVHPFDTISKDCNNTIIDIKEIRV